MKVGLSIICLYCYYLLFLHFYVEFHVQSILPSFVHFHHGSAGIYIKAAKTQNPQFTYQDYLQGLSKELQGEASELLAATGVRDPIAKAAKQLIMSNPCLHKVSY